MTTNEIDFPETGKCSLCGGTYEHGGNNPEPLKGWEERCCSDCNNTRVIPARLQRFARGEPTHAMKLNR